MSGISNNAHPFFHLEEDYSDLAESIVKKAVQLGADQAEAFLEWGLNSHVQVRVGETESIKQAQSKGLGLRVFINNQLGFSSSTDFSPDATNLLVKNAVDLARISAADPANGLPEKHDTPVRDLDIFDGACLLMETGYKLDIALEMEEAAFEVDNRICNSEGSAFRDACKGVIISNSNGALNHYYKSTCSLYCAPVVEHNNEKRYGYWYSAGTSFDKLENARETGRRAGERAVRMLGARKIKTQTVPVIFDPLIASEFAGTVLSCVNGEARSKKETCLWDKLDTMVSSKHVTIKDYGKLTGGIGSLPFDGEGVPTGNKTIIEKGRLQSFLYDTYAARKDGTQSTGNGMRSSRTLPKVSGTNFFIEKGNYQPEEIIRSVSKGLYITGLIGFGVNIVNGNYSRGAEGIWIENGKLTYPVHEVTVSGNILDMLKGIEMTGTDLRIVDTASAPTILINSMVVSGT